MESLIQIFRMTEISVASRIKIIKRLGSALNHQMGGNITEGLVYELVLALDPSDPIQEDQHYPMFLGDRP